MACFLSGSAFISGSQKSPFLGKLYTICEIQSKMRLTLSEKMSLSKTTESYLGFWSTKFEFQKKSQKSHSLEAPVVTCPNILNEQNTTQDHFGTRAGMFAVRPRGFCVYTPWMDKCPLSRNGNSEDFQCHAKALKGEGFFIGSGCKFFMPRVRWDLWQNELVVEEGEKDWEFFMILACFSFYSGLVQLPITRKLHQNNLDTQADKYKIKRMLQGYSLV